LDVTSIHGRLAAARRAPAAGDQVTRGGITCSTNVGEWSVVAVIANRAISDFPKPGFDRFSARSPTYPASQLTAAAQINLRLAGS
jgi:hypothetical protein